MKITLAQTAGFCFGVKRAVEAVYQEVGKSEGQQIYTYGPIIHNEEVIKDMRSKGIIVLKGEAELAQIESGIVIIRSHGVPKRIYKKLENKGITCVDATCPFVKKIHNIVEEQQKSGRKIIIIGNSAHPEVEGIIGWADDEAIVISSKEEAMQISLPENEKICIVAQTTFNYNKFEELVEIIREKRYDIIVLNTICSATRARQTEAKRIAEDVEAMIVIGDKHSSNTQKLFEICKNACENTYYIQTLKDLDKKLLESVTTVGITAGASTPKNIIEEVQINV
ncbi:MAG: 4-hydroxy-3-methylbut-2-enyl diphosphate reductase [Lachnospiraceae bacterium]